MIGAGAKILGNIEVGEGAKIGSALCAAVPPHQLLLVYPLRLWVGPKLINHRLIWTSNLMGVHKALWVVMVSNRPY